MPRPLLKDRCQSCRQRKVKCDGHRPVCLRCQRSSRECQWRHINGQSHASKSPGVTYTSGNETRSSVTEPKTEYITTKDPKRALQDPRIACIFRYYIDNLASWYDLNDSKRHFEDLVPICARQNSLLLSAILAFSAASQSSSLSNYSLSEMADAYHLESVEELLSLTENINEFRTGETLAAICLLRSYEIISQNISAQNHLRGSYSLIASGPNDLEPGLMRAGFWNYLREDITVALMEKRNLMIDLDDQQPPLLNGEEDFANYISYTLGRVINGCLHKDGEPLGQREWDSLKEELDSWKISLPSSFEPVMTPGLHGDSRFPSVWNTSKWHTASLQYYHTAMTILCLAEPIPHAINTLQHIERMKSIEAKLEYHAIHVCALAISSSSAPVWVNSFGPISFCAFSHTVSDTVLCIISVTDETGGPWLRQPEMLEELAAELRKWGGKTGWPVSSIVKSLIKVSD